MNIGQKIRIRREELGMTQEELSKKLGYASRSSVNKVENSREISMKKLDAYADALETTVSYLMGWTEDDIVSEIKNENELCEMTKIYAMKFEKLSDDNKELIMNMIDKLL